VLKYNKKSRKVVLFMFAQRLKQLRADRKINQIELAQKMGVTQGTVGKWETGRRIPDTEMLVKLADFFDVTLDYLFGRKTYNSQVALVARGLKDVPEEDREFVLDTVIGNTLNSYYKLKGS
jgi:transcriptional regulator with XRE-family HTH domain